MTVIGKLFSLTATMFLVTGCLSLSDGIGQVVMLDGKFSEISFRLPLKLLSEPPLKPDRSWKTGEYFEFEAETLTGLVTVRVRYELKKYDYFETVDVSRSLDDQLAILRQSFTNPNGRLVELFKLRDEAIPILAFSNVGGEYLAASVPVSGNYAATIYLMSDDAYQDAELLHAMKVILGTFRVVVHQG